MQKTVDIEQLREKQKKQREKAYAKAREKQQLLYEDMKANPEKYYKKNQYKPMKRGNGLKCKQKTARKTKEPYQSIFTDNMKQCYITGDTYNVEPHHIFRAADKISSEKFHFMLPIRHDWHRGTNYAIHNDKKLDLKYKIMCQEYWLNTLRKSKEEWNEYFRHWY